MASTFHLKKFRADAVPYLRRIPATPDAKKITARLIIEIIVKTAHLAILKADARQTSTAGHRRSHNLDDNTGTPFLVT
jgi:hypothetical protein